MVNLTKEGNMHKTLKLIVNLSIFISMISSATVENRDKCIIHYDPFNQDPYSISKVEVPGLFKSLFKWDFKSRDEAMAFNARLDSARNKYSEGVTTAKTAFTELSDNFRRSSLPAQFQEKGNALIESYRKRFEEVVTVSAKQRFIEMLKTDLEKVKADQQEILVLAKSAKEYLESIFSKLPPRLKIDEYINEYRNMTEMIGRFDEKGELKAFFDDISKQYEAKVSDLIAKENQRRLQELRYDLKIQGLGSEMLKDYQRVANELRLVEGFLPIEPIFQKTLGDLLEDSRVKKFLYRELQFLRRFKLESTPETREVLNLRAANTQIILSRLVKAKTSGSPQMLSDALALVPLRSSVGELSNARAFNKLIPKGSLSNIDYITREKILADALVNPLLRDVIVSSTVVLPQLPAKPVRPTFTEQAPSAPYISPYVKGASRKAIRDEFKRNREEFKQRRERYKANVENYRLVQVPNYNEKVAQIREMKLRLISSRQAFVTYLAETNPGIFSGSKNDALSGTSVAQIVLQHSKAQVSKRMTRLGSSYGNRINGLTSENQRLSNELRDSELDRQYYNNYIHSDSSLNWMLMFYTGNPMWIISPDIARFQLVFDLMSNHTPNHNHYDYIQSNRISNPDVTNLSEVGQRIGELKTKFADEVQQVTTFSNERFEQDFQSEMEIGNLSVRSENLGISRESEIFQGLDADIADRLGEIPSPAQELKAQDAEGTIDLPKDDKAWSEFQRGSQIRDAEDKAGDAIDTINDAEVEKSGKES